MKVKHGLNITMLKSINFLVFTNLVDDVHFDVVRNNCKTYTPSKVRGIHAFSVAYKQLRFRLSLSIHDNAKKSSFHWL